jgi:glutamate dehydrogenase/leucine dehydrogenase
MTQLSTRAHQKLLVALAIYLTSLFAANTLGLKIMPFAFGLHVSVGVIMFPVVFIMTDVPAPDVNTGSREMGWMVEEYSRISKQKTESRKQTENTLACFTGKSIAHGGSEGRTEATGYGGAWVLEELLKSIVNSSTVVKALVDRHLSKVDEVSVAVQGFGNVATYFVEKAQALGYKVVALSDSQGGIFDSEGIDLQQALAHKKQAGKLSGLAGSTPISSDELLLLDVDVLVPAALENVITEQVATNLKAKVVLELANGPTTPEADLILKERGVVVIPDILANSGGVATSYFEWYQNMHQETWSKEQVLKKLQEKMIAASQSVFAKGLALGSTLREAAYVVALERLVQASSQNQE